MGGVGLRGGCNNQREKYDNLKKDTKKGNGKKTIMFRVTE